ncbi:MAG: acyl carrier protein [Clostridiales Family XIII bacterium]|jgi:acyl carrier protein|nr:acyl carrier protein [Clostridiales Family XIII bacterium]
MDKYAQILRTLEELFREYFGDDTLCLFPETTNADIADWDSVAHIQLVFEIESRFAVRFDAADIMKLNHIGFIADKLMELSENERESFGGLS